MSNQKSTSGNDQLSSDHGGQSLMKLGAGDASKIPHALEGLADGVMSEAKKAAESKIASQKAKVVDGLEGVAHALRQATSARHEPIIDTVRPYVEKAADQVERVSSYVQRRSFGDMASDLESLARREPGLFLGGSFLLGLVGGRFLKSNAPTAGSQGNAPTTNSNGNHRLERTSPSDAKQNERSNDETARTTTHGGQRPQKTPSSPPGKAKTEPESDASKGEASIASTTGKADTKNEKRHAFSSSDAKSSSQGGESNKQSARQT